MTTQSFVLIKKSSLLPLSRCKTSHLFTDFIQVADRREVSSWKQTTLYLDRNMLEHNYSELFRRDSHLCRYINKYLTKVSYFRLFPTAHSLTILLSIYESIDGQRTFYKTVLLATFHCIYIEQLSMLFFISPRVIYIYIWFISKQLVRFIIKFIVK